jgi:hypothetical protein
MRYLKSTIAGILALSLIGFLLFTILILVAWVHGDANVAIVPDWHSWHFWLTATLVVGTVFGAGIFWEYRNLAKNS